MLDVNYYPVPEAELSNKRHRPIGIGIQGLHDVFQRLSIAYDSEQAEELNKNIFETMYHAAVHESMLLAKLRVLIARSRVLQRRKGCYSSDLHGVVLSDRYNWNALKDSVKKYGLRNSLLVAPMPTASTAQILGNTESFEPRTSNLYTRRVLAGEYMVVNPHLQDKLVEMGVWNEENRMNLIANRGSVKGMDIPDDVKSIFKTVFENESESIDKLKHRKKSIHFVRSQSLNLYLLPTRAKVSSMAFTHGLRG